MRRLLLLGILILLMVSVAAAAQTGESSTQSGLTEPKPQTSVCQTDSKACRRLAVEVAILDFEERIQQEIDLRRGTRLLCPENDPECCPPHLMPFCFQAQRDLVLEARRSYQQVSLARFDGCPFGPEICGSFGSFYCDRDESWTPWTGCAKNAFPPISCPPGWSSNAAGGCEPPPPCRCGYEHNSKGICIPKVCYFRGLRIPCRTFCGEDQVFVEASSLRTARSPLGRNLTDSHVQLEAARRIRQNLEVALEMVDREIRELSSH